MIQQITVFLENKSGRLSSLCAAQGEAGIDMQALTIADTADYGVVRIICAEPERAAEVLRAADYPPELDRAEALLETRALVQLGRQRDASLRWRRYVAAQKGGNRSWVS